MHGCLLGVIDCGGVIWFKDGGGGGGVQGGKRVATIPPPHLPFLHHLQNLHRQP